MPEGLGGKSVPTVNRKAWNPRKASVFPSIKGKNIFNADHRIPNPIGKKEQQEKPGDQVPVPTTLPLKLLGTIVHSFREYSVATIQVRGKSVKAVAVGKEIKGMARIQEILRYKVIFLNLQSQNLEYVEIKEKNRIKIGINQSPKATPSTDQKGDAKEFTFKRDEIEKYLDDLPKVLQDAKAVPYIIPGSGGEVGGFKLIAIKPGSVYEKLGLKKGDLIKKVNGESVDSPQKAMDLYHALKSSDEIRLEIGREGTTTTLNYKVQ